jgi:polar amino acid transport system substrate-binding protein
MAALLGTLLGAIVCMMRMSKSRMLRLVAKVYIDLLRGIPQVVLLMLMFYVVFSAFDISGVWVATFTFAMNFAAYVSEMFRTSIESVKKGQTEAGVAMGFSKTKTFLYIVLPQAVQRVLPVYKGEFIALVKMTSIVGYIAVQDLTKASDIIRSRTFDAFFPLIMVAILYFLLAWSLTLLLEKIQVGTAPKRKNGLQK